LVPRLTSFSLFSFSLNTGALFWAGTGLRSEIETEFFIIPDENCQNDLASDTLPAYNGQTITLFLPRGKTVLGSSSIISPLSIAFSNHFSTKQL